MDIKRISSLINPYTSDKILDSYYSLTYQPTSIDSITSGYVGKLHRYNDPFPFNVEGAYPLKHDYEFVMIKIKNKHFEQNYGISNLDLERAFKSYGLGFIKGFSEFENDIVKSKSTLFSERIDHVRTIFEYATSTNVGGYPESFGYNVQILSGWDNAGKQMGYFYRAWYLILENHTVFTDLFDKPAK